MTKELTLLQLFTLSYYFSGLTVIIIGQEETTTTSDPSTATLLHIRLPRQNSASTDSSRAGENSSFSLAIHKSTLATTRSPGSPEGRRTREQPSYASRAWNGRPEWITPRHFGRTGTPRGGRRHAASIWGSRWPHRARTVVSRRDRPFGDARTHPGRGFEHAYAAPPATGPLRTAPPPRCSTKRAPAIISNPEGASRRRRRRRRVGTRNFPNFFPNL